MFPLMHTVFLIHCCDVVFFIPRHIYIKYLNMRENYLNMIIIQYADSNVCMKNLYNT